jgi:hypothetical protein
LSSDLTKEIIRVANRDIGYSHVLRTKSDKIVHRRIIITFYIGAKELAACPPRIKVCPEFHEKISNLYLVIDP